MTNSTTITSKNFKTVAGTWGRGTRGQNMRAQELIIFGLTDYVASGSAGKLDTLIGVATEFATAPTVKKFVQYIKAHSNLVYGDVGTADTSTGKYAQGFKTGNKADARFVEPSVTWFDYAKEAKPAKAVDTLKRLESFIRGIENNEAGVVNAEQTASILVALKALDGTFKDTVLAEAA